MRMRSEDGRNLAMHRMMSDSTWDATYWMSRAKRAMGLPAGAELPIVAQREIGQILADGEKAKERIAQTSKKIVDAQKGKKPVIPDNGPDLPPLSGPPPKTLYGTQEVEIGKTPRTPAELKGAVETLYGELQNLGQSARDLPELKGAVETIRGRLQEITDVLEGEAPKGPDLQGAIRTVAGAQKDIGGLRAGMEQLKQQKIKLARKMKNLDRSGWTETIIALRNVGLLTGIKTHLRNIGGNASFQVLEELQRIPAATVDLALSLKTGQRTVQGASPKAMAAAINEARTKGFRAAKQVMREGASVDELGKVELHRELNSGVKWLDTYHKYVVRTMSAEDRVFKSYAYRRSLEEQAVLKARNGGPSIVETLRNPPESMVTQAIADANFATFNNSNVIASGVRSMQGRMRSEGTAGKVAAAGIDLAVPFKNTPANIIARVFDYAGAGFVKAGYHAINSMVQGSMTPAMQRAISQGMGRGMTGAALITLGYSLAQKGLATGVQPTEAGQQNVAQAAGRLPGAIRAFGRWNQVAPFSPAGNLITIGATLQRESSKPLRDEARRPGNIAAIATRTALEQPMLKGLSDIVEAARNPAATGERVTSSMIGSFVPTLLADSAALFDPYMRDSRSDGFLESLYKGFQNRTPGWRNFLPVLRDVFGEAVQEPSAVVVNPMISTKAKEISDPAIQRMITSETSIGFPRRDAGESKESYSLRSQIVGREIKRRTDNLSFDVDADMDQKRSQIKKAVDAARDQSSDLFRSVKKLPEAERIERLKERLAQ
jgi:hypothetical protein